LVAERCARSPKSEATKIAEVFGIACACHGTVTLIELE
jgi:hypothetical protein